MRYSTINLCYKILYAKDSFFWIYSLTMCLFLWLCTHTLSCLLVFLITKIPFLKWKKKKIVLPSNTIFTNIKKNKKICRVRYLEHLNLTLFSLSPVYYFFLLLCLLCSNSLFKMLINIKSPRRKKKKKMFRLKWKAIQTNRIFKIEH